jgi:hypothetical protein
MFADKILAKPSRPRTLEWEDLEENVLLAIEQ